MGIVMRSRFYTSRRAGLTHRLSPFIWGCSQGVKASVFDTVIRTFKSCQPCQSPCLLIMETPFPRSAMVRWRTAKGLLNPSFSTFVRPVEIPDAPRAFDASVAQSVELQVVVRDIDLEYPWSWVRVPPLALEFGSHPNDVGVAVYPTENDNALLKTAPWPSGVRLPGSRHVGM